MSRLPFDALAAIATNQWGLFTTRQALTAGFTTAQLRWQSRPGGPFEQVLRSVYRLRNYAAPALQVLGAALLARGPDAVACGNSAGWAHGFDGVKPGRIEMIIPARTSAVRDGIHRPALDPSQIAALGPFRMTDALTTLLDLAATLDDVHWEWALEFGFRRKLFTPQEVDSGVRETQQEAAARCGPSPASSISPARERPSDGQSAGDRVPAAHPTCPRARTAVPGCPPRASRGSTRLRISHCSGVHRGARRTAPRVPTV
jgi:hypothetical protein